MLIILDYDGTYTQDPELWLTFVKMIKKTENSIICCTMRHPFEGFSMCPKLRAEVKIVYTSRGAKRNFLLQEGYDLSTAVWIDDNPHWILEDCK